jgi:hypothetical protein
VETSNVKEPDEGSFVISRYAGSFDIDRRAWVIMGVPTGGDARGDHDVRDR